MTQELGEEKAVEVYQNRSTPYCKKIYFDAIKCGNTQSNHGITIQWGLYPWPSSSPQSQIQGLQENLSLSQAGYLLQYIVIKQAMRKIQRKKVYYTWPDYTEVWNVYKNKIDNGFDHFCVPRSEVKTRNSEGRQLYVVVNTGAVVEKTIEEKKVFENDQGCTLKKLKGCRIFTAEAWFVPSKYLNPTANERVAELKDMGFLDITVGKVETSKDLISKIGPVESKWKTGYPLYKRKVVIKQDGVCIQDNTLKTPSPDLCSCYK